MNQKEQQMLKLWLKKNKVKVLPNKYGYAEGLLSAKPKTLWDAV